MPEYGPFIIINNFVYDTPVIFVSLMDNLFEDFGEIFLEEQLRL